jgi:hypothetical protein
MPVATNVISTSSVVHVVYADRRLSVGHWGPIFMLYWTGEPNRDLINIIHTALYNVEKDTKDVLFYTIIDPKAPLPKKDIRGEISEAIAKHNEYIKANAVLYLGEGFLSAAFRSFILNLGLKIQNLPYPVKVFKKHEAVSSWLSEMSKKLGIRQEFNELLVSEVFVNFIEQSERKRRLASIQI